MAENRGAPSLSMIPLDEIEPNENNPRGPRWREDDPQFESLRSSIRERGILVPLVVMRRGGGFLLVDGERRYYAAKSLRSPELGKVPAYVFEREVDAAELQSMMFHIHMNRLQWNAAQQCRASEALYGELIKIHGGDATALRKAYVSRTGMDTRTARNRLQFLKWPGDVKKRVYEETPEAYWYVVEIEDKIIEPAEKNYPEYFRRVPVDDVRRFLFQKFEEGLVTAAVEVRQAGIVTKSNFSDSGDRKRVVEILTELAKRKEYSFRDAREEFLSAFPSASEQALPSPTSMLNSIRKLTSSLLAYEVSLLLEGEGRRRKVDVEEFSNALSSLQNAAQKMLKDLEEA